MSEEGTKSGAASATEQLLRAAAKGEADTVHALLAAGTDINASNQSGQTALIRAAFFGLDNVVRVLLDAGAEAWIKDKSGLTALDWATRRGFVETSRLLQIAPPARPTKTNVPIAEPQVEELPPVVRVEDLPPVVREIAVEAPDAFYTTLERSESVAPSLTTSRLDLSSKTSKIKHCPVCNRTYDDDVRSFCSYHPALLVDGLPDTSSAPTPIAASKILKSQHGRPLLWVLLTISALGGILFAYFINNHWLTEQQIISQQQISVIPSIADGVLPVVDGAIKGREISLPLPQYPEMAKNQGLTGEIIVAISVNRKGNVIAVRALNGSPILQQEAETAARKAKFAPGKSARRSGTIKYNFK